MWNQAEGTWETNSSDGQMRSTMHVAEVRADRWCLDSLVRILRTAPLCGSTPAQVRRVRAHACECACVCVRARA